jgi:hypothetical protein
MVWQTSLGWTADQGASGQNNDAGETDDSTRAAQSANRPAKKVKWNAEELRAKYPFKSLAERLKGDGKRADHDGPQGASSLPLTETARQSLDAQEAALEINRRMDLRRRALQALHSDRVEEFINESGFGKERMPTFSPSPSNLELPDPPTVPFAQVSPRAYKLEGTQSLALPATPDDRRDALGALPALSMLHEFHVKSRWDFLDIAAWGGQ